MGNSNPPPTSSQTILTDFHKDYSRIFSENTNQPNLTQKDLLKIFPNRTLFCKSFLEWMPILSYKKTANKESFIFACEIFTLEGEEIISTVYKNHSYIFIEIFFHMTLKKLPVEIAKVTLEEVINFAEVFTNFFFKDNHNLTDLPKKIVDLVRNQTDIKNQPVLFHVAMKYTH